MEVRALWEAWRPKQWTKNLFILAALIFSKNLIKPDMTLKALLALGVFCVLSSSIYLLNDIVDAEKDKQHPKKCNRPIPSGRLSKSLAGNVCAVISLGGISGAFALNFNFGLVAAAYLILFVLYSFVLKNIVIIDVMCIAVGFVMRVVGGALVIEVEISDWLLLCTVLLALFLALSKRRNELTVLEKGAANHRTILAEYSTYFLDQMIAVVTASTVMAYSLYTMSPETIEKFHTNDLIWTVPFVLYGIFRYLYLVHRKDSGGDPTKVLLTDYPLMFNTILWLLTAIVILYMAVPGAD